MPAELTPEVRELLSRRNMAHVATVMDDGAPQVTPVWIAVEDGRLAIFTGETSIKARNLRRDGRAAISICDEVNPYRSVVLRGRVARTARPPSPSWTG
jgi:PPOX class probable F420-dependent enzyme